MRAPSKCELHAKDETRFSRKLLGLSGSSGVERGGWDGKKEEAGLVGKQCLELDRCAGGVLPKLACRTLVF